VSELCSVTALLLLLRALSDRVFEGCSLALMGVSAPSSSRNLMHDKDVIMHEMQARLLANTPPIHGMPRHAMQASRDDGDDHGWQE
jgi:hypothetical protein